jgi:hypothetical protein
MRLLLAATVLWAACKAHNPAFIDNNVDFGACDPSMLNSDPHHCGGCGNDCTLVPNVDPSRVLCVNGGCFIGNACLAGFGDCSPQPGCETDLADPAHCGSCNRACDGATPLCAPNGASFSCVASCPPTAPTNCTGRCASTSSDPQHCGSCDPCPSVVHGQPTCTFAVCGITCDAGFHACNDLCLPNASPQSCGSSCTPCVPPAHASPTCNGGVCDFICDSGFTKSGTGCVPNGNGCTNVMCTSGLVCADGACCGPPASFCSANADCCSGRCNTSLFGACDCTPSGNTCKKDGDCCTLRCTGGKCACNALGVACGDNTDCCSGTCDTTGHCACAAVSGKCSQSSDCCSGVCGAGGVCQCRTSGTCKSDGECCNGRCDGGSCNPCTGNGGACSTGATCCSGNCSGTGIGNTCQCVARGSACGRNSDCCSNFCSNGFCGCAAPPAQAPTDKCSSADDCCWGTCSAGTCFCKAAGDSCLASSECCDQLQCVGNLCTDCLTGGNCTTNVGQTQCCTSLKYTCPGVSALCCGQKGAVCFSGSECCNGSCGVDNRCST